MHNRLNKSSPGACNILEMMKYRHREEAIVVRVWGQWAREGSGVVVRGCLCGAGHMHTALAAVLALPGFPSSPRGTRSVSAVLCTCTCISDFLKLDVIKVNRRE